MKNAILIVEMCSEGSIHHLCDYDSLPEKTKTKVDQAIKSETRGVECDIYEYGFQSVRVLKEILAGSKDVIPESKYIDIAPRSITKDNVEAYWEELKRLKGQ